MNDIVPGQKSIICQEIQDVENEILALLNKIHFQSSIDVINPDQRWLSIGKEDIRKGFQSVKRAFLGRNK